MRRECIELLEALGAPVEHIVLTTHAYEHKIFVPPFQRRYGKAQVWVVPRCAHTEKRGAEGAGPGHSAVVSMWSAFHRCCL